MSAHKPAIPQDGYRFPCLSYLNVKCKSLQLPERQKCAKINHINKHRETYTKAESRRGVTLQAFSVITGVHIMTGVSAAALCPLPQVGQKDKKGLSGVMLYLSQVCDATVGSAVRVIKALQPPGG